MRSELLEDNMDILTFSASQIPFTGDEFPAVPLLIVGGVAVVIAVISIIAASRKKDKDDDDE